MPEVDDVVRSKYVMDGSTTLQEAAAKVRAFAEYLDMLALDGWELTHPVDGDYGFIHNGSTRD